MTDDHATAGGGTLPLFPGAELSLELLAGFPAVHDAYRGRRDQRDMVCGAYVLAYLLRAYGVTERNGTAVTVDSVAAAAGTTLEAHNADRLAAVRAAVETGDLPAERARTWYPHDEFAHDLGVAESGGTSPEGFVRACEAASGGRLAAVPVPAVHDGRVQLTAEAFDAVLSAVVDGRFGAQVTLNYNLSHTLAPAGILGHKYGLTALLTRWDDPEYFRRLDWDVGHFTSLAGRLSRADSDRRYLLVRDSYRTFGWEGYHLQPESYVREGLVRADDDRDGGLLLVVPATERAPLESFLSERGLATGVWDNGSPYRPVTDPFGGER
jgi:hypothetical protein